MIEETGTVIGLRPAGIALVQCQKSSACGHCVAKGACSIGVDSGVRQVEASNELGASIGDRVLLVTSTDRFLRSSLILYGVPMLFLLGGAIVGRLLGGELLSIACGLGALVASFFVIRLATAGVKKTDYMPRIAKVLEPEEPTACQGQG